MNVYRVTPNLFIRGMFDTRKNRVQELDALGVTMVACMLKKHDPVLADAAATSMGGFFQYLQAPLADSKGPPPTTSLNNAWKIAALASDEIKLHGTVLIHCIGARDRAPFTAALTLHLLEGISGPEAMLRVRNAKRTTFYNEGYKQYLLNLEAK